MNHIYEKLFETYGESLLNECESYNEEEILAQLNNLSLDGKTRIRLADLFFDYYTQWSVDAFSVGLHLGLSLLCDDIRRLRAQEP